MLTIWACQRERPTGQIEVRGFYRRVVWRFRSALFRKTHVRRAKFRFLGRITAGSVLLVLATAVGYADDLAAFYTQRTRNLAAQSFDTWQSASAASTGQVLGNSSPNIRYSGGTKAAAAAQKEALRDYLSKLVPKMAPSSNVAHIPTEHPVPVDVTDPEKKWTGYYAKAKHSLRPNIEYSWKSNAARKAAQITLTEKHVKTLKDNFDVLMWYRNELDVQGNGDHHLAARQFTLFLDYFVAGLLDGLPAAPKINIATGKVDGDEWELDELNLREQVIMAYRYLIAKYQIYPEYEQFGPADRELLVTMMKIAFLMGAHMNPDWFQEMDVDLHGINKKTPWKKPMVEALVVLQGKVREIDMPQEEQLQYPLRYEQPCIIAIPAPKPKKVPKPPPPKPEEGQKIEIIIRPPKS